MNTKKRLARKLLTAFLTLSLLLNLASPALQLSYAEENSSEPTAEPTVSQEQTQTETPTAVENQEITPTPEVTPEEIITPTPSEEPIAPSPTPVDNLSPPAIDNSNSSSNTDSTISPVLSPTTAPQSSTKDEKLSALIFENISASSLDTEMLESQVSEGSASLATDKTDYAPTDTALITGSNLLLDTTYSLTISSSDEPPTSTTVDVTSNSDGVFVYAYQLDGKYRPNYKIELKDSTGNIVASTIFTDTTPAGSFVGSSKYIRENNHSDVLAQISVPDTATEVSFTLNGVDVVFSETVTDSDPTNNTGDNDIYKVTGAGAGLQWWRIQKDLLAGNYNVSSEFNIGGTWYPVSGSALVYVIGSTTYSYIIPGTSGLIFRPSDNFARARIADQYMQFTSVTFQIFDASTNIQVGGNYLVERDNCDLRSAGNYVDCDLMSDYTGVKPSLSAGQYYLRTQSTDLAGAGIRYANTKSDTFTIDSIRPTLSDLRADSPQPFYKANITVSAIAIDDTGINNVEFYITAPRISDGVCDGNGTHLKSGVISAQDIDGRYRTTLDISDINGGYCVNAIAEDNANSHSFIDKFKILVDNIAPTTTIGTVTDGNSAVVNAGATTNSNSISIPFTASDGSGSGVIGSECQLDGGSYATCSTPFTTSRLSDGSHTVNIRSTDAAGNVESTATFTWTVDATVSAPTIVSSSHVLSTWNSDRTIYINWSATDASGIDGYSYSWNQNSSTVPDTVSEGTNTSNTSTNRPTSQSVWFHIRAFDGAGNWSSTTHYGPFWIDAANPTASWTSPATNSFVSGIVSLQANANDVGSGINFVRFRYKPSGGSFVTIDENSSSPYQANWNTSGLTDGNYVLRIRAEDQSGRYITKDRNVTVDNTAPVSEFSSPENDFATNDPINISGSSTDIPMTTVDYVKLYYKISGSENSWTEISGSQQNNESENDPFSWSFNWTPDEDGTYDIKAEATDKAGNTEASPIVTNVVYDTTSPSTPDATPGAGDYASAQSVTLASSDTLSGLDKIFYTIDGSTPDNTKTEHTGAINVDHDLTLKAISYDNAGNASGILEAIYGIAPVISDEVFTRANDTSLVVTWTTDDPATSRVIYDTVSHSTLGSGSNYGYPFSTVETDSSPKVTSHSVRIEGLSTGTNYYYRVISHGSPDAVGEEYSFTVGYLFGSPGTGDGLGCATHDCSGGGGGGGGGAAAAAGGGAVLGVAIGPFVETEVLGETTPSAKLSPSPTPTEKGILGEIPSEKVNYGSIFPKLLYLLALLIPVGFWFYLRKRKKDEK